MANNDVPEDMEVDENNFQPTPSPTPTDTSTKALMASSQDKDGVQAILSFKWSEDVPLQKCHHKLQKVLQTWSHINNLDADFKVSKVSEDDKVEIRLTPASGKPIPASELQKLSGQALHGKDGKTVTILSVTLTPLQLETQQPSTNLPPSPDVDVPPEEQSSSVSTEEEKKEEVACSLSVGPFWYVSHIYKKEVERIEKENGVKITADVKITFEATKDGNPEKALSEFTSLVQKYSSDLEASHIPLKHVDPEEVKEVMKIAQREGSKLLFTLTPEEIISWGPRQSQDTFRKSTQKMLNISTSVVESGEVSQDTSQNIGMSIKDPLVNAGLTMEENYWKLMTTSYLKQVAKIKTKFGVDFKESGISQGKVEVKVCYKRSGENASMESHALRALLHLYQKIATSPLNFSHLAGATGFRGSPENLSKAGPSEGGTVWNGTSGNNTEAPTGGGATAGDNQEDNCSICLDTFQNKKQLKCKHEFCEACLEQSKASMGPTCPLCKYVFGMMEGDQPDGKMTTEKRTFHLDGYRGCGTIVINYIIPEGTQTAKHPHPGKYLSSCNRTAYLPDNKEGREVLHLLEKAFKQKLIFTVGTSRTSGMDDVVTWNNIHHKTNTFGGPHNFGYPDPHYLDIVREELKAKGIE
ncbi:E3 ubiquitin-protein ligase DTX3L-like isoform X1 [Gymnodraco acuticeps]|uniref:E3 ubiquitin-protein ligase n=2 Tax=Gymnodraco acuticeps TaxID=8218 RepID=A0A6P8SPE7_GYMAC|nr:E3 ubiquitin-protein ligase DTX3L-like isoform X1 [Gymnodraco acuticeps]